MRDPCRGMLVFFCASIREVAVNSASNNTKTGNYMIDLEYYPSIMLLKYFTL